MLSPNNRPSTGGRTSVTLENGYINSPTPKVPNLINFDETKRATESQYGKTLNVPNTSVLRALPLATPPAPINPPRPAIMTTPKMNIKNPSINLPQTELRPTLLVTANNQQQTQTKAAPNGIRLPLNGRLATVVAPKQRQQPPVPMISNNHQMINEIAPKKHINSRPRTALFFTRKKTKLYLFNLFI
jgi:hypothetical protein